MKNTNMEAFIEIDENFVKNRPNKTYPQIYKELCMALNCQINNSVTHSLKSLDFSLNLEQIHESDVPALSILLSQCALNSLYFYGKNPEKIESVSQMNKSRSGTLKKSVIGGSSETKSQRKNKESNKSIYQKPEMLETILRAVSINLEEVHHLTQVRLQFLRVSKEAFSVLSEGIAKSNSLSELIITHCELTNEDLEAITNGLCQNSSLIMVDFSHNKLSRKTGTLIGKILSSHCEKRNEVVWMYSLRGEYPEEDLSLKGICEINLAYNQIDDVAVRDICQFLKYDTWTRSINLRGNFINEEGIREITEVVLSNESIISIDLRNNPGFTKTYSRLVLEKLIKNIQALKQNKLENARQEQVGNNEDFEKYLHDNTSDKSPISGNFVEGSNTKNAPRSHPASNKKQLLSQQRAVSQNPADNEPKEDNNIIKSLYEENPDFINRCKNCYELEKKLLKSEQKNVNLMFENKKLKDAIGSNAALFQQNLMHSWSAINPNLNIEENQNPNVLSLQNPANNESEELLNRIENLMVELTRMMDNLENANHSNVTHNNNLTYQLTNSTSNTYQLMNSANNINFNSLLNNQSNNLSNIVPNINNNLANRVNLNSPAGNNTNNSNNNISVGNFGGAGSSGNVLKENLNKSAGFKQK